PPEPIEEEDDGGAERQGAQEGRDAHSPRHLLLRVGRVDVEVAREPAQRLVVIPGQPGPLLIGQNKDPIAFEVPQLVSKGSDEVGALLGLSLAHGSWVILSRNGSLEAN